MRKRTTDELLKLISTENSLQKYLDTNKNEFDNTTLAEALNHLLGKSTCSKADIVRLSNLDKVYTYQIFDGTKSNPSRNKLLAICISLGSDLTETQYILRLGHAEPLHPRNVRDSVIIFAINHKTSIMDLNNILYDMKEELIT